MTSLFVPCYFSIFRKFAPCALAVIMGQGVVTGSDTLVDAFENPPLQARPLGWWHWINGNVTKEGIDADLEDMKRIGMGGVQLFDVEVYLPPGPVRYGTDQWHEHFQHAVKKAGELGLELHTMNTPGWSASGGPWVTAERSMKRIVFSESKVKGGEVDLELPKPDTKPFYGARKVELGDFYRDVAVFAVPVTSVRLPDFERKINFKSKPVVRAEDSRLEAISRDQVIDLTSQMSPDGRLRTTLPDGDWDIIRFGFTTTGKTNHPAVPEGHGLEIDKLDADAVAFQFEQAMGRMIKESGPLAGSTYSAILFDSFEGGFQNWTDKFPEMFKERKGYDIVPFLPLLTGRILESEAVSEAVLWDFRQAIEDLMAENYFGTMHRLAAKHGMKIYSESQGGPLNPMAMNRYVDVPMNEFWMPEASGRAARIKQSVSSANFLGRQMVAAEAFTATPENARFIPTPANLKRPGDQAFTYGLNRFCFHSHTHQPVTEAAPGFSLGRYGTHFGRLNTWWPYVGAWISYLSRSQALLQEGRTVSDICLLVDEDLGYGLPSRTASDFQGYDFAASYPTDLMKMTVEDGVLVHPDGGRFSVLVTPQRTTAKSWVAEIQTLQKIHDLVTAGATIVGPPPIAPAGLEDLEKIAEFDALVEAIWGGVGNKPSPPKTLGQGKVYAQNEDPAEVLGLMGIRRDLSWAPETAKVLYIHRRTADADFYFVSNDSENAERVTLTFRQSDLRPEIWDPVTGKTSDAPIFETGKNTISVPVDFEPYGSAFFVFQKPLPAEWVVSADPVQLELKTGPILSQAEQVKLRYSTGLEKEVDLSPLPKPEVIAGPWNVKFIDGRDAPEQVTMQMLTSWSESEDAGIRYYSGSAIYTTGFTASAPGAGQTAILDLGEVADIARVKLNGREVATLWHPPFRTDITEFLASGENKLEVHVANRWINRMIGDAAIEVDYTYQPEGRSKFTDGRLEVLPDWLYDPVKRAGSRPRHSFAVWQHYKAEDPLVPSGLLGPVEIHWFNQVPLSGK